jgi:hypothetical protein
VRNLLTSDLIDTASITSAIGRVDPLTIGDPDALVVLADLAGRLLRPAVSRRYPELASLGFFLRKSEVGRVAAIAQESPAEVIRVPRGLHFHIPPANVDTVFVYSWALSLICGNPNVVRVSARTSGAAAVLLEALGELLHDASPRIRATQWFVGMDHDDPAFADLSLACAQRVVWGGDAAVAAVRKHPLGPRSVELTFPDRASLCVIAADRLVTADDDAVATLVQGFTNDVWWFDQAACSSPRTLIWLGDTATISTARSTFLGSLDRYLEQNELGAEPSMAMQRRIALYGVAMTEAGVHLDFQHPRYGFAQTTSPGGAWLGAGGFIEHTVASLDELMPHLDERDQTLTYHGFGRDELIHLVTKLGGRSLDRIVPIGQALQFGRFWDGFDLLSEMTKTVVVATDRSASTAPEESIP